MSKKISIIIILVIVLLFGAVWYWYSAREAYAPTEMQEGRNQSTLTRMQITSNAFSEGERIPAEYTCEGENTNPELRIDGIPDGAKSLALIVDDPDAPGRTFTHWLMWNIAPDVRVIERGTVPDGVVQGENDAGEIGYMGPCPPEGHGTHRYFFTLYALDDTPDLGADASKEELEARIEAHKINEAQMMGVYERE